MVWACINTVSFFGIIFCYWQFNQMLGFNNFPRKVSYYCWIGRGWYWTGTLYLDIIVSEVGVTIIVFCDSAFAPLHFLELIIVAAI